ncbi:MAG: hypothetical protein LBG90_04390 [Spirochaetaceae bacterium]|nr:hypothetical protein [Spirochaetaceae bacterium]
MKAFFKVFSTLSFSSFLFIEYYRTLLKYYNIDNEDLLNIFGEPIFKDTFGIFINNLSELFGPLWIYLLIINIICPIILFIKSQNNLFQYMQGIKFGLMPFWILDFFLTLPFAATVTANAIIVPFFLLAPGVFIFMSYLFLLYTSLPTILFLVYLKKTKQIKLPMFILHLFLQLCFCVDIAGTIILVIKYKKIMIENKRV